MLLALVFITTFLNAQSVDPETFPLFSGDLKSKNLYTNTGGEGKVSIQSILDSVKIVDTISLNYNDFYTLITGGNLQVGKTYIIMDFQTIYDQMDFDNSGNLKPTLTTKTGAIEQIWVLALSSNQIADKAYSATYPNDEIQYDWTYSTTLVNGAPAKGRITERIDEWNNRTDYDHREIKFIRYDDGAGNFTVINDNGNASQEFLTFGNNYGAGGLIYDNWLGDFYSIGQFIGQEYGNNVFQGSDNISNISSAFFYNNTFSSYSIFCNYLGEVSNNIFSNTENLYISGDFNNNTSSSINNTNIIGVFNNNTPSSINNTNIIGVCNNNLNIGFSNTNVIGDIIGNTFNFILNNTIFNGVLTNCIFMSTNSMENCFFYGDIQNKTIDETTYPFLFGTPYKKDIFLASDNNVYARYFDGTNDVNVLIP